MEAFFLYLLKDSPQCSQINHISGLLCMFRHKHHGVCVCINMHKHLKCTLPSSQQHVHVSMCACIHYTMHLLLEMHDISCLLTEGQS